MPEPARTSTPSLPPAIATEPGSAGSPVQFDAAREGAVVCSLDHLAVLAIGGADASAFLHGQLSSDVKGLAPDACQYTSYNSPKGRMLANFVLWREGDGNDVAYRALLPVDIAESVRRRLAMFVLRSKVTLGDVSIDCARFGIGGPAAADALRAALGAAPEVFALARTANATILGLPGPRYVVIARQDDAAAIHALLEPHAKPVGFPVWQWLTIRAGVPVITASTQDLFVAQTVNWDVLGGVNFRKGCYPGQEIIARMQYLGRLKERLFAFRVAAADVAAGARLYSPVFDDQPCGTVVNAAAAPEGGCDVLAVLQLAAASSGNVRLGAPDGPPMGTVPLPYALPPAAAPAGRDT
jgi:folate-binding protein YgfZ